MLKSSYPGSISGFSDADRSRFIQQVGFGLVLFGFPYCPFFYILGLRNPALMVVVSLICFGIAIFLAKKKKSNFSGFFLILTVSIVILYFGAVLGPASGAHHMYFAMAALPVAFFGRSHLRYRWISSIIPIICFFILSFGLWPVVEPYTIPSYGFVLLKLGVGATAFGVILSAGQMFLTRIIVSESRLIEFIDHLNVANTQLHQTNQSLSGALEEIQHQATIGAVTRGIMHEVMGPISAIKASCDVVVSEPRVPSHAKDIVSRIDGYLDRLTDLIQSMLVNQGKIKRLDAPLDINKSILQAVRLVQNDATRNHLTLTTQLGTIPTINGSVAYFSQAILNLLLNAIRYSPPNSQITVKTWQDNQDIWITIQDQGPGIAPAIKDRLFQQGATTAGADTGNNHVGLGLFFVKQVAEAHGGEVKVLETSDKGTVFGVRLRILDGSPTQ